MAIKNDANAVDLPTSTELALDPTRLANERTLMAKVSQLVGAASHGPSAYACGAAF